MKQVVVISGKGGTGKTVLTASFAALAKNAVFADCDVDTANLHLLLHPEILERYNFYSGERAIIDGEKCINCKECLTYCRFEAIKVLKDEKGEKIIIDPVSCEGCRVCSYFCPAGAIKMEQGPGGEWFISKTKYGPMVHAKLGIARENSGKLVTQVRQQAKLIAEREKANCIIIDGPPGTGCPVIASLSGVDLALIVTEPTLSGIHDMERILGVTRHFGVKTFMCINKYGLNLQNAREIEKLCETFEVEVVGRIPFDKTVVESMVKGTPVVVYGDTESSKKIKDMWKKIEIQL